MSRSLRHESPTEPTPEAVGESVVLARSARLISILAALALGSLACGGGDEAVDAGPADTGVIVDSGVGPDEDQDDWGDTNDNCPADYNPEQRDRDGDGIGDVCDPCPATPNAGVADQPGPDACAQITETEPNNLIDQGQVVALPPMGEAVEIKGAVEAPSLDGEQAFDRYKVMVGARTMLKIRVARLSSESLLEPLLRIEGGGYTAVREAQGLFVAERYAYFAEAGTYDISVTDRRGVLDGTPYGDLKYEYGLSVQAVEVSPLPRTPPVNAEPFTIGDAGEVFVLDMTLSPADFTLISAETDLDLTGEGADTILVLERADGTVVENDSLAEGFSDARIIASVATEEQARIVLDHARVSAPGEHPVALTVTQPDTSRELEPNSGPELASELVFPGETSGQIGAPLDPEVGPPDVDWYYLDGEAGDIIALTGLVRPASSANPIMALVRVHDLATQDFETLYLNTDSSGNSPRIEAILPATERYYIVVADELNLGDPPYGGGAVFEYGIFAERTGVEPDSDIITSTTTMDGVLEPGGRLKRHVMVTDAPTMVLVDLEAAGQDTAPYFRIYGPDLDVVLGEGETRAMAYLPTADSYLIAVHNANDGLGGATFTYDARVSYQAVVSKTEQEPNDDPADADLLTTWRDTFVGETSTEDDIDMFTFTASAGATLDAVLAEGGRLHQVAVTDDSGAILALGVGRAEDVALPADGRYFVVVGGVAGPYRLLMRLR